ncbi:PREDICTED: zeatin O-glucosyltransferase-like [Ipomoea nil]|uniref:zeatin O-glucosyltransferase-like n=1 Tax=Ipomoea nil TaxID=35883 RepID=UPI0009010C73|nr:PREDICTED: zeatin O-glucosyltransferase-like [Ipomoea nil]XP_019164065.1 PREDICTED: zeatin O-glucosyltransferase-like [Ipomoea nil]
MDRCNDVSDEVAVVMVPLPAQGHLNQLLQFCCIFSSHGLPVHYVGSAIHNQQARLRANGGLDPNKIAKIHFHDLPTPDFASPSPNPNASFKFPTHLQPTWDASQLLRHPTARLLRELASKARRIVVIHDYLMSYVVQDVASIPNAESYNFNCVSVLSMVSYMYRGLGKKFVADGELRELMPPPEGCTTDEIVKLGIAQMEHLSVRSGDIHNSNRLIEGPFIDLLEQNETAQKWKKQWFIAPILPANPNLNSKNPKNPNPCLDWLDEQPQSSVLYISFGTTTSMSEREVRELALGLEHSKQKFLWVLRDSDKGDIFSGKPREIELPEGFEERVKGVGMVVRDWAPQPEILAHRSTGGFMSHCGWNSCMESITFGVPITAWPMHSDQPFNSFLVAQVLKTGLMVREWADRGEVVNSSAIENVVRRLMASEEGDEIRKRAQKLGENVRKSAQEEGVSQMELNSFIAHITR